MSFCWPALVFAVSAASCSRRLDGAESALGQSVDPLVGACCITDVQTDGLTYHFDSPRFVLEAAEGLGPRVLALTVAGFAGPVVSTTVSPHPTEADITAAVGYSLGDFYYLQASSALTVDTNAQKRLEAYVNYARSVWVVREPGCGAVLGTGMSFKPIGVYFLSRDVVDTAIPGSSLVSVIPGSNGGPCGVSLGPDVASMQASDAGAGDAGTP
jgi:hypothetical protein